MILQNARRDASCSPFYTRVVHPPRGILPVTTFLANFSLVFLPRFAGSCSALRPSHSPGRGVLVLVCAFAWLSCFPGDRSTLEHWKECLSTTSPRFVSCIISHGFVLCGAFFYESLLPILPFTHTDVCRVRLPTELAYK